MSLIICYPRRRRLPTQRYTVEYDGKVIHIRFQGYK